MGIVVLIVVVVVVVVAMVALQAYGRRSSREPGSRMVPEVADAAAEARRWIDRLGAGVALLNPGNSRPARQALADAAERHGAAEAAMTSARTSVQFAWVTQTALEGLYYIRAARIALGLDPGPDLPSAATTTVGTAGPVDVNGRTYYGSPDPGDRTPYYFPGGTIGERTAPGGWYSHPWWKTAAVAGVAGVGGALLLDSLLNGFGPDFAAGGGGGGGLGGAGLGGAGFDGAGCSGGGFGGGGGFGDW